MYDYVAPHAGAWIETRLLRILQASTSSHPMRVRGLKLFCPYLDVPYCRVAPHAGAWIETYTDGTLKNGQNHVAPHAGAWIETRTL